MREHHLVAIYPTNADAGRARDALISSGFSADTIRMSSDAENAPGESGPASSESHGFLSWLFGSDVPAREREWYGGQFRGGRTAVSIKVASEEDHRRAEEILDASGAVDLEYDSDEASTGQSSTGQTLTGADSPAQASSDTEEVIPIVKEELAVGKRVTERHHQIRTHVIEQPAEAQVNLKDETVVVERRPASGQSHAWQFGDREVEIVEKHEEPVVEKKARADEELVVHKDVKDRTETIKDKVRETKVDVGGETGIGSGSSRK